MSDENVVLGFDFGAQVDSSAIAVRQGNRILMSACEGEDEYTVLINLHDTIESQSRDIENKTMMLEESSNLINDYIEKCKDYRGDIAELVKELEGAGEFARFLINNLSCATTEEDAHCLHLIDTAVAKHKTSEGGE